jgi:hypothetical protein
MSHLAMAVVACLALATAIGFAPASAFARGGSHGGGSHGGGSHGGGGHFCGGHFGHSRGGGPGLRFGFYPHAEYYPGCVWVRRLVPTRYGLRWRRVPVCY